MTRMSKLSVQKIGEPMSRSLRIGTRGSALAIQQTQIAVDALHAAWPDLTVDVVRDQDHRRPDSGCPPRQDR